MDDDRSVRFGDDGEREVRAEVKAILKGHSGGVLDLRIDEQWIVSWFVICLLWAFTWLTLPQFKRCSDPGLEPQDLGVASYLAWP